MCSVPVNCTTLARDRAARSALVAARELALKPRVRMRSPRAEHSIFDITNLLISRERNLFNSQVQGAESKDRPDMRHVRPVFITS